MKKWIKTEFREIYPDIEGLRTALKDIETLELGGEWRDFSVRIQNNSYYDGDGDLCIVFEGDRIETDREHAKRLAQEAKLKEARIKIAQAAEAKERAQYEKLKAKFEPVLTGNNSSGQRRPGS